MTDKKISVGDIPVHQYVSIDYTNWRGERRVRKVYPTGMFRHGTSEWHKEEGWLFEAKDEDGKVKEFSLGGVHSFEAV